MVGLFPKSCCPGVAGCAAVKATWRMRTPPHAKNPFDYVAG